MLCCAAPFADQLWKSLVLHHASCCMVQRAYCGCVVLMLFVRMRHIERSTQD